MGVRAPQVQWSSLKGPPRVNSRAIATIAISSQPSIVHLGLPLGAADKLQVPLTVRVFMSRDTLRVRSTALAYSGHKR
jgi:hypothetical protein